MDSYEKYIIDCEEKEKAEAETKNNDEITEENKTNDKPVLQDNESKWKERRECLEMLKKELKRVRDGGDMYDWDYLLEEDEKDEENKNQDSKMSLNVPEDEQDLLSNEKSNDLCENEDKEPKKEK